MKSFEYIADIWLKSELFGKQYSYRKGLEKDVEHLVAYGAHLVMGECNMEGTFGKRDIEAAKRFYIESIKGSTPMPVAEIQLFNIFYRFEPDYDKSHFYCESAINHGDPTGSVYLARGGSCQKAYKLSRKTIILQNGHGRLKSVATAD